MKLCIDGRRWLSRSPDDLFSRQFRGSNRLEGERGRERARRVFKPVNTENGGIYQDCRRYRNIVAQVWSSASACHRSLSLAASCLLQEPCPRPPRPW